MKLRNQLAVIGTALTTFAINVHAALPAGVEESISGVEDDVNLIGKILIGIAATILGLMLVKGLLKKGT